MRSGCLAFGKPTFNSRIGRRQGPERRTSATPNSMPSTAAPSLDIGPERDQERMQIGKQMELQQTICLRPGISYAKVIFDVDKGPDSRTKR